MQSRPGFSCEETSRFGKCRWIFCAVAALSWSLSLVAWAKPFESGKSGSSVLILHDSRGPSGWLGEMHARLLANLLGHFALDYQRVPVESYQSGLAQDHEVVFYFGTVFDNPLPTSFLRDLSETDSIVCWFKYNLWQLSEIDPDRFVSRFGFRFDTIEPGGFTEVLYKGESFSKHPGDPDLGRTTIINLDLAQVRATIRAVDGNEMPYAVQSGRFWYLGDSPFSFMSEEDRYVVFADLLHDILERDHPAEHRALIRLEDITPGYPSPPLEQAADLLAQAGVPFAIALIPVYEDPLGVFNQGAPQRIPLIDDPALVRALQHMVQQGGQIMLHGYTHQYGAIPNPYTGLSGDDYEFFRVRLDESQQLLDFRPVEEDSPAWVQARLDAAREQLFQSGFSAVGWVTPHYTASDLDYRVFATNFLRTSQRAVYFDEAAHAAGQFFPYPIERDLYGQQVLPENLGYLTIEGDPGGPSRSVADMLRIARKNLVVRDGWASGFFHPFLDVERLGELVRGMQALGYRFTSLTTEEPPSVCGQSADQHHVPGSTFSIRVTACGAPPFRFQWQQNDRPIPGATQATFLLTNLQSAQLGTYRVAVSNDYGATISYPIEVGFLLPPLIQRSLITNDVFQLWFHSEAGLRYYAEYQDFLGATSWTATLPVVGSGHLTNLIAPLGTLRQRFYRLRVE